MLRNYKAFSVVELVTYEKNARKHTEKQINQVAKSITEFGFTAPILIDENKLIIAGHCRLEAAKKLGLNEVPCLVLDGLTESQKRAYVLADNKLTLNADWDFDLLKAEFASLKLDNFDLTLTGFDLQEIDDLFPREKEFLTDEDSVPTSTESIVKLGDVWILGNHRLMCGDSLSIDNINTLIANYKMDLIFTDPPYGVKYQSHAKTEKNIFDVIKNDDLSDEEFKDFLNGLSSVITTIQAPYYIWCNWKSYANFQSLLPFTSCIVWAKNFFGLGNGYRHQHEFCLTNAKIDKHIKNESDLWNVSKDTNYIHPTQKPVSLAARALDNHKDAKNIIDLFGGSGSTLIACETLDRHCFMMELDEKYCDIIIKRWEEYTGKKAVKEECYAR